MKTSEKLRKELCQEPEGVFAPYYFRYIGMAEAFDKPVCIMRAGGIASIFKNSKAHIFKNDMIAGIRWGAYVDENTNMLEHARKITNMIGERNFFTNKDHFSPDYRKVLRLGIPAMIDEINASIEKYKGISEKTDFLSSAKITLEAFCDMLGNYEARAIELQTDSEYDSENLKFIADNIHSLINGAPKSFAEALQLVWMCHTAFMLEERGAMALGRMDQYLYPFYENDIKNGKLTKEKATELLENAFSKLETDNVVNICIGGKDKDGVCCINELSFCILDAVRNSNAPGPNLSARITSDTPDEFLDEALKSIGTGLGYPALMNDEVNIEALKKYGYSDDDVYDYTMVGCIENFITGKQPPWSDGRFDTPRFLDYVLNNGVSKFNKSVGLKLGEADEIHSMEEFMKNFEAQLEFGVKEYCVMFDASNNSINQKYFPEPFLSCFCEDCIGRGLDINNGGSIYPSVHGVALMGVGTVCDSLAAIEKVVFTDKSASLCDVRDAVNCNFEGYEELHRLLLCAPKYGNGDDFADKYAVWFVEYLSSLFAKHKTRDGGGIYTAMAANTSNITAGKIISATPDGRKQGEPLSDAASPTYGRDKCGPTVTLHSVSKPDYTKVACGTVVNQKFSPSMFDEENRKRLLALVKTYFKLGGQEIQMNATSRDVLKAAMKHPENYGNLVVRVSGFSDYYTRLSKDVQMDILSRTQHE